MYNSNTRSAGFAIYTLQNKEISIMDIFLFCGLTGSTTSNFIYPQDRIKYNRLIKYCIKSCSLL